MERHEMKNVILELFDQQRQLNARLIEMQKVNEEKEQSIAMLTRRIDELIAQTQQGAHDSEAIAAMQRQWEKESESFKKTISDLQDIIKVLKADKFKGPSRKKRRKDSDKDGGDNGSSTAAGQSDLSELKADFDGRDADGSIASATFQTLLATCHTRGVSRLKYLKDLFRGLIQGRTDYQNMVPALACHVKNQ